jgi:hypothetical protein
MIARGLLIAGCLVLAGRGTSTEAADRWIHVKVDDARNEERVRVNVPLELVVEILPLVSADRLERGRVRIELDGAGDTDFRAVWAAVRKAKDGEYATVQDKQSKVRVRKAGGLLLVEAREGGEGAPGRVNVRLPLAVVDALFGANAEELDILAAVKALGDDADGVVVEVEDGQERVRVWIDDQSGQQD